MSLIYQALMQSERRMVASPSPVEKSPVSKPKEGNRTSPKTRYIVGLGAIIIFTSFFFWFESTQGFTAPKTSRVSSQTASPSSIVTTANLETPAATFDTIRLKNLSRETPTLVPKADPPLPVASIQPTFAASHLPELKKVAVSVALAPSALAMARPADPAASTTVTDLNPAAQSAVATASKAMLAPTVQPTTEDMRTLFNALNHALEGQDKALAQSKLQEIQSRLAESSVARLRAESWFAHQTGDLDNASRIYRRLLEKMPGDELTNVNLAAIEKMRQRSGEAKAVLAKALRHNPSSTVLRSAVEQLAQSEVRP